MKKPGKAKPKKRARKPGQTTAHVQTVASGSLAAAGNAKLGKPTAKRPEKRAAPSSQPLRRDARPLEIKSLGPHAFEARQVAAAPITIAVPPPIAKGNVANGASGKAQPARKGARKAAKASGAAAVLPSGAAAVFPSALLPVAPAAVRTTQAAIPYWARNEQAALALLLAPLLIVSVWMGLSQSRRPPAAPLPEIAALPVATPPQIAPLAAPVAVPPPPPPVAIAPLVAPGPIVYPPAQASIDIARPVPPTARVAVAPVLPPVEVRAEFVAPGPAPTYPNAAPEIELPRVAALAPVPAPLPTRDARPSDAAASPTNPAPPPTPADATGNSCQPTGSQLASFSSIGRLARAPRQPLLTGVDPETFGRRLSDAAVAQSRDLVIYTARYQPMAYPLGDVVALHGACIDVVIRAYRVLGIDLQEEVQKARGRRGDPNIDHRRTENMRRFLEQKGASLPITSFPEDYKPGDIVTYHRPFSRVSASHIAIVTDILAPTGRPMIVHNRGYGAQLEDALFVDRITGHYRYLGPAAPSVRSAPATAAGPNAAPVVRASLPRHGRSAAAHDSDEAKPEKSSGPRPR